jgi:arylsulfatase A-like enzyme
LIRVPLIIRFPHDDFAGLRVSEPVSLLDVIPAIMDYLDRPELAARGRGRSLLPLIEGGGPSGEMRLTAMRHNKKKYYRPHKEKRGDLNAVIRQGTWKGIWNVEIDTFELYDLARDPRETMNLSESEIALARTMRDFARSQLAACRAAAMEGSSGREPELDEEIRRRLETLGYLDGGGDKPKP